MRAGSPARSPSTNTSKGAPRLTMRRWCAASALPTATNTRLTEARSSAAGKGAEDRLVGAAQLPRRPSPAGRSARGCPPSRPGSPAASGPATTGSPRARPRRTSGCRRRSTAPGCGAAPGARPRRGPARRRTRARGRGSSRRRDGRSPDSRGSKNRKWPSRAAAGSSARALLVSRGGAGSGECCRMRRTSAGVKPWRRAGAAAAPRPVIDATTSQAFIPAATSAWARSITPSRTTSKWNSQRPGMWKRRPVTRKRPPPRGATRGWVFMPWPWPGITASTSRMTVLRRAARSGSRRGPGPRPRRSSPRGMGSGAATTSTPKRPAVAAQRPREAGRARARPAPAPAPRPRRTRRGRRPRRRRSGRGRPPVDDVDAPAPIDGDRLRVRRFPGPGAGAAPRAVRPRAADDARRSAHRRVAAHEPRPDVGDVDHAGRVHRDAPRRLEVAREGEQERAAGGVEGGDAAVPGLRDVQHAPARVEGRPHGPVQLPFLGALPSQHRPRRAPVAIEDLDAVVAAVGHEDAVAQRGRWAESATAACGARRSPIAVPKLPNARTSRGARPSARPAMSKSWMRWLKVSAT